MKSIDGARIRAAIRSAQAGTTARIGVRLRDEHVPDALEGVRADFARAGLHEHPAANAVLFLVAPKSRTFAVYGGDAIHARAGDAFWKRLVEEMTPYFANDQLTQGLVHGIEQAGHELRAHFPSEVNA